MTFTSKEKSQRPIKDTGFCARSKTNVKLQAQRKDLPFTKSVQTGKYFGVLVTVQAYAANQKLLVNLTDHRTWDVRAFTGHPRPLTYGSCSLLPCTLLELGERGKKEKKEEKRLINYMKLQNQQPIHPYFILIQEFVFPYKAKPTEN